MFEITQKFERAFERFDEEDPCFRIDLGTSNWNNDLQQVFTIDRRPMPKGFDEGHKVFYIVATVF